MNTQDFIKALCQKHLKRGQHPIPIEAILTLDGQPPSTGLFAPEQLKCGLAKFSPIDGSNLDNSQSRQGVLIVSGRTERLRVTNFRCCQAAAKKSPHYHFDFELIPL